MRRVAGAIADRLRSFRYFLGDLFFLFTRPLRGLGHKVAERWRRIAPGNRRRIAVASGAIALIAVVVVAVIPNLPCGAPGGDECAPPDDAIGIVPVDAVAYVHVNVEPGTEQYEQALDVADRTPELSSQVIGQFLPRFLGSGGATVEFGRDVAPWFGGELAIAAVPGASGTQQVQMIETTDQAAAIEYAEAISAGAPEPTDYQGIDIREDQRGLATAVVDSFLVLGTSQGVRATIDAAEGVEGVESLADDDAASAAMDELPDERFAEAFLSAEGIDSLLALSDGPLAPLEPLVDSGDSTGAAFSISATDDGYELASRSLLDPERGDDAGGFFAAFSSFEPTLTSELDPDTLVYVGLGEAQETIDALLAQATVRAPGIARGVTDLVERLRKQAGVDISEELLPSLGGEAAFAVAPRPAPEPAGGETGGDVPEGLEENAPETLTPGQNTTPYLQFVAGEVDEEAARNAMARLQKPLAETVDPDLGSPVFREQTFGAVAGQVLQRSPADVLAYAVADSKLVVANDVAPIERLDGDPDDGLAASEAYESATEDLPEDPSLIAYLNLSGLVTAVEQLGAAAETPFSEFAPDLRRLQTFALTVGTDEDILATDSRLRIAAP